MDASLEMDAFINFGSKNIIEICKKMLNKKSLNDKIKKAKKNKKGGYKNEHIKTCKLRNKRN